MIVFFVPGLLPFGKLVSSVTKHSLATCESGKGVVFHSYLLYQERMLDLP